MTRDYMIFALSEWGIPARNTSLLSTEALTKMYLRYMPITDAQVDEALAVLEAK